MKYESCDQKVPVFEAKGIETVRKDQCALTQKILLNALITIFQTQDILRVKEYLCRQWSLIHTGCLPISDFILTGRVRSHYRGKMGPVQAALARRLAEADPGRSIQNKERLPYVIVASPGRSFKLRDCVLTPGELLLHWSSYTIHSQYYAAKHVNAALNRCFSLPPYNIDINEWYNNAPKPMKRIHHWPATRTGQSTMISTYFGSDTCVICHKKAKADSSSKVIVCKSCKSNLDSVSVLAMQNLNRIQYQSNQVSLICRYCNGCVENSGTFAAEEPVERKGPIGRNKGIQKDRFKITSPMSTCTCIDCPITYKRHKLRESEVEALSLCRYLNLVED
jgi:DNA polymerase zeta